MEPENIAVWIPFLAIPLGIGMIITLMVLMHRAKIRELDQRHRERMAAIEKGLDPSYGAGTDAADAPRGAAPWTYESPAALPVTWPGLARCRPCFRVQRRQCRGHMGGAPRLDRGRRGWRVRCVLHDGGAQVCASRAASGTPPRPRPG